ncbi:hypothetical protein OIU77_011825 [Salix suchowensis]|uniref:Uncharacterized protein n=1 Tax=Salix suchowensis TaxID=1278906 RepID=A0ABQ9A2K8_9ROSI|nr:hypothetical protein OIU77_011825 [Salix suchowensis]
MTQPPALRGGEVVGVKQLLKRLLQRLNRKFARILLLLLSRHKSAASLGALVGFALSIIFTWRFLRQRKIKGPAVTDDASSTTRSYRDQELGHVDYQLSTNSKLFLQQTVKKKLNGGRKVRFYVTLFFYLFSGLLQLC